MCGVKSSYKLILICFASYTYPFSIDDLPHAVIMQHRLTDGV